MKGIAERTYGSMRIGALYYTLARHLDTRLKEAIAAIFSREGPLLHTACWRKLMLANSSTERCRLEVGAEPEEMIESCPGARGSFPMSRRCQRRGAVSR